MAYDFANTILRSLQTQDELNMRKQQMGLEEARFQQQIGQQNRQFGLEQDRLNATLGQYQAENKFKEFNAVNIFAKAFHSQYESKDTIPSTLTKDLPSNPDFIVSPEFGSQFNLAPGGYYSKDRMKNIKTAADIQHGQTMEEQGKQHIKIAQQNANANTLRASTTANKETTDSQQNYNDILNADYVSGKDLVSRGLIKSKMVVDPTTGEAKSNVPDGAFVYYTKSGIPRLFYSKDELTKFANQMYPKVKDKYNPNNNDPLGIK